MQPSPGVDNTTRDPASFRDPDGFVFYEGDEVFRQVGRRYRPTFDRLMATGLYQDLCEAGLLVKHEVTSEDEENGFVIKPELIPFIAYPYEWCFGALKDAALATIEIMARALRKGMWLKDASAYNIQFRGGAPVFIDTLSFEPLRDGEAWPAYHQFCRHFLAPVALTALVDTRLATLLIPHIDGIPLDLASRLLPARSYTSLGLALHVHAHAHAQRRFADRPIRVATPVRRQRLTRLIEHLRGTVEGLKPPPSASHWVKYCDQTNYSPEAMAEKHGLLDRIAGAIAPKRALDLGANTGTFSRLLARSAELVISADSDPGAVQENYRLVRLEGTRNVHPVVIDLFSPSPAIGWANIERSSFAERARADLVVALALVHHLAIGNNLSLSAIAQYLASLGRYAVVEFVPKGDSQVQRMLSTREDVFHGYTEEEFRLAFSGHFDLRERLRLTGSHRELYVLERKRST